MNDHVSNTDKFRATLVAAATIGVIAFNWLAAVGLIGGVSPDQISAKYPTPITPAGYAFTIWSLIYLGLIVFSIYQILPANLARFRSVRSLYILTCALNCGWIYMWHSDQIAICLLLIVLLAAVLFLVNLNLRGADTVKDYWAVKAPFQIYFGWVTAASLVNFFVLLVHLQIDLSPTASRNLAIALIAIAAALGVLIRVGIRAHLYPLAIAWALTAIAVKQSGQTLIIVACAVGVIACLIAALSFVVTLSPSDTRPASTA